MHQLNKNVITQNEPTIADNNFALVLPPGKLNKM